jgi:hypothetical protein
MVQENLTPDKSGVPHQPRHTFAKWSVARGIEGMGSGLT